MNEVVIGNKLCTLCTFASARATKDKENLRFRQFSRVKATNYIGENIRCIIKVIIDDTVLENIFIRHDFVHLFLGITEPCPQCLFSLGATTQEPLLERVN